MEKINVMDITYNSTVLECYTTTDGMKFYDYHSACEHQRLLNEFQQTIVLYGLTSN